MIRDELSRNSTYYLVLISPAESIPLTREEYFAKMGKKNKKDKQGKGKEKTELKTERKAAKKVKKELAAKGEVT